MKTFRYIYDLFRRFPKLVVLNISLLIVVGVLEVFSVVSIAPVVDVFLHPDFHGLSRISLKCISVMNSVHIPVSKISIILVMLGCVLIQNIFTIVLFSVIEATRNKINKSLVLESYDAFFNSDWRFFASINVGKILNSLTQEISRIANIVGMVGELVSNVVRIVFYLILPFYISWQATCIILGLGVITLLPFLFLGKINYKVGKKVVSNSNDYVEQTQGFFVGAKTVLGYGNQDRSRFLINQSYSKLIRHLIISYMINISTNKLFEPIGMAAIILVVYFSVTRYSLQITDITVLIYAFLRAFPCIGKIASGRNSLHYLIPSYEQVIGLIQQAKKFPQKTGTRIFSEIKREISFKNVSFGHPNRPTLLFDLDIVIPKNKMIAFVGESGAGKSTIVDLLIGLYEVNSGEIAIDGIPLFDYNIVSYRKKIGFVPQDSVLFNLTIRENLLWSFPNANESDLIEACKMANAYDFIERAPQGLDTIVGDRGIRLSGGERQRIALARAIIRKPELLILDEATSALDTYSERLIQNAIEKISKITTTIAVSHRLSTIMKSDWIYVLENGRIIEQGSYETLTNGNGKFKKMVALQALLS